MIRLGDLSRAKHHLSVKEQEETIQVYLEYLMDENQKPINPRRYTGYVNVRVVHYPKGGQPAISMGRVLQSITPLKFHIMAVADTVAVHANERNGCGLNPAEVAIKAGVAFEDLKRELTRQPPNFNFIGKA